MKIFKKHGLKIIGAILVLILILTSLPQGRAFGKTLILLPEFIPNSKFKIIQLFTQKPQITEVIFQSGQETIYADLWSPAKKGNHPAAVLHLGVDIDRKDERAQKLADVLARSGIVTLIPNINSLHRRRLLAEGKDDLVSSFEYLKSQPNVKTEKIGFLAFCAAGGLAILAAEDPKISADVAFVTAINPYFDLNSLYENITLRQINDNGRLQNWRPHFKTVEIYNRETIGLLPSERDREILRKHLILIEKEQLEEGEFPLLSQEELSQLSPEAKFTWQLLTNKDPKKTLFFQNNTTEAQKNFLKELSPSTNTLNLKAKVFILADVNNVYIPFSQAKMLASVLPKDQRLFMETKILPEGNLVQSLPLKDYLIEGIKIFKFIFQFLLENSP